MTKFENFGLKKEIVEALNDIGFDEAFPIQEAAIPHIMSGEDVIGQAHTGTGKTAAFSLPILDKTEGGYKRIQALVLVPTRELAVQVVDEMKKFAQYTGHKILAIYGGQSFNAQDSALRWGKDIIVATPGRLMDFIRRGLIDLRNVKFVVLDEADRMLDMGFIDDVKFIMSQMPQKKQVCLFSATMPPEIMRLTNSYMNDPVKVLIDADDLSAEKIEQTYLIVKDHEKFNHLCEMLKAMDGRIIIFCATKYGTRNLSRSLYRQGFRTSDIHGDLSQHQREESLYRFKSGKTKILVATDVASRGLDIPQVEHVINYDVPNEPMSYFHRIGRTARAGASGKAFTLVSQEDYDSFESILQHTKVPVKRLNEEMGVQFEITHTQPAKRKHGFRGGRGGEGFSRGRRGFRSGKGRRDFKSRASRGRFRR